MVVLVLVLVLMLMLEREGFDINSVIVMVVFDILEEFD